MYSCVRFLSETVAEAGLLQFYRYTGDGRKKKRQSTRCCGGNTYPQIIRNGKGDDPKTMKGEWEYGEKFFANGAEHPWTIRDPFRVRESWKNTIPVF